MMRHISTVLLVVLVAIPRPTLGGQDPPRSQAAAPASQEIRISSALYFREITLDLRDGTTVRGRLSAATAGSIRIQQGDREEDHALKDVRRIVIDSEAQRSRGIVPGIVFGLYAGNSALLWEDSTPGFYARPVERHEIASVWLLLGEGFFAAMGGGLGWLAHFGGSRQVFEFPADFEQAPGVAERFARFLTGGPAPARVHVLFQGGLLVPGATRRFGEFATDNGFALNYSSSYPTKFSLLRSIELSYSIRPRWRTGLRLSFPSEPFLNSYVRNEEAPGSFTYLNQDLRSTAVHAIGALELAGWKDRSGLAASVGLGAGFASVRLTRNAVTSLDYIYTQGMTEVRKVRLSAVVFGAVQYRLTPVVSIGLAADYTFVAAVTVPALPANGVPGGAQGLSNGSLGFVIGYHF